MRIGICSYWFNRGQAVVARQMRSALEDLGHETHVLARPTRATNIRPAFIDRTGVWDQPRVTEASAYEIPKAELLDWARRSRLEVCFFDQNYGFEAISALRRSGVRTIGRFVWEQFSAGDVGPARDALDLIYSLTACEQQRYRDLGIRSPRVPWGIHPELLAYDRDRQPAGGPAAPGREAEEAAGIVRFFFPGGFMSKRKPFEAVLEAFSRVPDERLRLVFKSQVDRRMKRVKRLIRRDRRVEIVSDDLPAERYMRLFAAADVCLAPSRWEGLGLHLYEAIAFGMPIISNDNPPMNEVVRDGVNGILVRGIEQGTTRSGLPSHEPDVEELARAIARLADAETRSRLGEGARETRKALDWNRTVQGYAALLESSRPGVASGE
jgi:1,2-diacylglycerol 3-alpha-glucosyltransferase